MRTCIGIIAGSGQFPRLVAYNARATGYGVIICGFHGHTDPALGKAADSFAMFYLGQFEKVIAFFRTHGVRQLCMAGAINKPKALNLHPDLRAARILLSLHGKGDDALLRAIIGELEREGFNIVQASSFSKGLSCPKGVLTQRGPTPEEWSDIIWGWPIADALGRFDIGQSLVVKQGMVVAVECLEGTDTTLRRGGKLGGAGCVALKRFKPGQDDRADMPSVGLSTVRLLLECGYSCLAVEAGKTLFFDRDQAIALADAHHLCIIAITQDDIVSNQAS